MQQQYLFSNLFSEQVNRHTIGKFAMYWVKMFLTSLGFEIEENANKQRGNEFTIKLVNGKRIVMFPKAARVDGKKQIMLSSRKKDG